MIASIIQTASIIAETNLSDNKSLCTLQDIVYYCLEKVHITKIFAIKKKHYKVHVSMVHVSMAHPLIFLNAVVD